MHSSFDALVHARAANDLGGHSDGDSSDDESTYVPSSGASSAAFTRPLDIPARGHPAQLKEKRPSLTHHASTSMSGASSASYTITPKAITTPLAQGAGARRLSFSQQCLQAQQHQQQLEASSSFNSIRFGSSLPAGHSALPLAMPLALDRASSSNSGRASPSLGHSYAMEAPQLHNPSRRPSVSIAPIPVALMGTSWHSVAGLPPLSPSPSPASSVSPPANSSPSAASRGTPSPSPTSERYHTHQWSFPKPPLPPPRLEEIQSYDNIARWPPHVQAAQHRRNSSAGLNHHPQKKEMRVQTEEEARAAALQSEEEDGFPFQMQTSQQSPESGYELEFEM